MSLLELVPGLGYKKQHFGPSKSEPVPFDSAPGKAGWPAATPKILNHETPALMNRCFRRGLHICTSGRSVPLAKEEPRRISPRISGTSGKGASGN